MSITKKLLFIPLVAVSIVGGLWSASVLLVSKLSGTPTVSGIDPLTWIQYTVYYYDQDAYREQLFISGYLGLLAMLSIIIFGCFLGIQFGNGENKKQHGDARFANKKEVKKTGLLGDKGLIVGKIYGQTLRFDSNEFVMLSAPTRGGKGVSVVIPNALDFDESMVVMDVKGENQELTSKYRESQGHKIYCFNPFDEDSKSHGYNPLYYVRSDERYAVGDLVNLGSMIYPAGGAHAFFQDTARNLFVGLGLLVIETPSLPRSIGEMLRQASGKGMSPADYIQDEIDKRDRTKTPFSEQCKDALNRYLSTNDDLKASIMASFLAPLTLFQDKGFDAATSRNDFDFNDLRREKMTIYFGIPVSRMDEATLLVNMFWSQLIAMNTKELPSKNPDLKYKVVLLMDEMPMMGRVGILAKGSAFIAGYNLRLVSIVQSPQQLYASPPEGYGRETARALISNHSCKLIFTPDELADAEDLSKMLGTYTYKAKSLSYGQKKQNFTLTTSGSQSDQSRPLMMAQELREIPFRNQLIMMKGHKPIYADKITYYNDPYYVDMLKSVSPSLKALGKIIPNQNQFENAWAKGELMIDIAPIDLKLLESRTLGLTKEATLSDIESGCSENIVSSSANILDSLPHILSDEKADEATVALLRSIDSRSIQSTSNRNISSDVNELLAKDNDHIDHDKPDSNPQHDLDLHNNDVDEPQLDVVENDGFVMESSTDENDPRRITH